MPDRAGGRWANCFFGAVDMVRINSRELMLNQDLVILPTLYKGLEDLLKACLRPQQDRQPM